eukprot:TRINITY_DN50_c0_g1_i7.p1 TRINITY_DN50_c0_g1~~TRINITY_DN50_c0_g1_i7.p1  ORF type:complete len:132 (-),score=11.96 TRINITY_DN50_c0_g1_i7:12-407(-)
MVFISNQSKACKINNRQMMTYTFHHPYRVKCSQTSSFKEDLRSDGLSLSGGSGLVRSGSRSELSDLSVLDVSNSDDSVVDLSLIHISEPTRRTPISYAVFCLKKKKHVHLPLQLPSLSFLLSSLPIHPSSS